MQQNIPRDPRRLVDGDASRGIGGALFAGSVFPGEAEIAEVLVIVLGVCGVLYEIISLSSHCGGGVGRLAFPELHCSFIWFLGRSVEASIGAYSCPSKPDIWQSFIGMDCSEISR